MKFKVPNLNKPRTWVTNSSTEAVGIAMVTESGTNDPAHVYSLGDPKGTDTYSVEELKEWGMVGVYKQPYLEPEEESCPTTKPVDATTADGKEADDDESNPSRQV